MPDLLTHILIVYAVMRVLATYTESVARRYVPIAMAGAILPDFSKVRLLIDTAQIETLLGVSISWSAIHRLGSVIVLAGIVSLWVEQSERRPVFGVLLFGACTQFPLDALVKRANGLTPPYLYPFTLWQPPAGNLYLSSDPWPVIPAIVLAIGVWYLTSD